MTTQTLVTIAVLVILLAVAAITVYLVRALQSLTRLFEATQGMLEEMKVQTHEILDDLSDSASSVREVIVRLQKLISGFISLPDFAKTFAKQTLHVLFKGVGDRSRS